MSLFDQRRRVVAAALAAVVVMGAVAAAPAAAVAQEPARASARPARALDRPYRGEAAITKLGERLPDVAAAHGLKPGELMRQFRADETLWVDPTLRLYFVEPQPTDEAPTAEEPQVALAPVAPLVDTFLLESHPGAARTIFLDFNSTTPVTGTAWNNNSSLGTGASIATDPYDTDGNPAAFSDQELQDIQDVWQRVKEDYAPWEVNVTTKDPGAAAITKVDAADESYGTRVVIDGGTVPMTCGCGGIAYLGVFDIYPSHAYYQPTFAFQGSTGSLKGLAEAISHEVGHNLGLSHDGLYYGTVPDPANPPDGTMPHPDNREYYDGGLHDVWAPIMGVGYYKPLVQWSGGDYPDASNPEDDFTVMESHGLLPVGDDHGNGPISGVGEWTALGALGPSLTDGGVIGTREDSDWFFFTTTGGLTTIEVGPAAVSPNLDVSVSLWRDMTLEEMGGGSNLVAEFDGDPVSYATTDWDVAGGLGVSDVVALEPDGYFVEVKGVGALDPANGGYSDYGSLGAYELTVIDGLCTAVGDDAGEDDDSAVAAQLLIGGTSVSGTRCAGDEDWYLVPGLSGAEITVDLSATDPLGDLDIELLDASLVPLELAETAGSTEQIVHTFTANEDHYLRVHGAAGIETRYDLVTAMPVCPPDDRFEGVPNGDDYPHQGYVQPLEVPGVKDAVSCIGDVNGDFVEVDLLGGREFEATIHFPSAAASSIGLSLLDFQTSGWSNLVTQNTSGVGYKTLAFTPPADGTYEVRVSPWAGAVPYRLTTHQTFPPTCASGEFLAEYFDNMLLAGTPVLERCESAIANDWGVGGPGGGVPDDFFSVRWTGTHTFTEGEWQFETTSDDGVRLEVDGDPVIDNWTDHPPTVDQAVTTLSAGDHSVVLEYYEKDGGATAHLKWAPPPGCAAGQFLVEYFPNRTLSGAPTLVRCETEVDHSWATGSPDPSLHADRFSARWTATSTFSGGTWDFVARSDDGVRVRVDDVLVIDNWTNHAPTNDLARLDLTAGDHTIVMEYYEAGGGAVAQLAWEEVASCPEDQFLAEYFTNKSLSGPPVLVRCEATVDNGWGTGSPDASVPVNGFSARWTMTDVFVAGDWDFTTVTDDGVRLKIDNALVIDNWTNHAPTTDSQRVALTTGEHTVVMEYYEAGGGATARLALDAVPACAPGQFLGEYYANRTLSGAPALVRCDDQIDNAWGLGSPDPLIPSDGFSVRWTLVGGLADGAYEVTTTSDDGIRVFVNGTARIDNWTLHAPTIDSTTFVVAFGPYPMVVEYFEAGGGATAKVVVTPR